MLNWTESDPFLQFSINNSDETQKTQTISNTSTPVWNETHSFIINDPTRDILHISLYDEDLRLHDLISTKEFIIF